jgi:hypothetical protein
MSKAAAAGAGVEFEKGDQILYTSNSGEIELGVILNIHYDDTPPYYTIKLARNNNEKVTDAKNLTLLSHEEEEGDEEDLAETEDQDRQADPHPPGNIDDSTIIDSDSFRVIDQRGSSQWITWVATTGLLFSLGIFFSLKYYKKFQNSL